jgi:hypothetical protein
MVLLGERERDKLCKNSLSDDNEPLKRAAATTIVRDLSQLIGIDGNKKVSLNRLCKRRRQASEQEIYKAVREREC